MSINQLHIYIVKKTSYKIFYFLYVIFWQLALYSNILAFQPGCLDKDFSLLETHLSELNDEIVVQGLPGKETITSKINEASSLQKNLSDKCLSTSKLSFNQKINCQIVRLKEIIIISEPELSNTDLRGPPATNC